MFDTLIKNGIVIDGTGARMFRADVGVKDGMIQAVGDLSQAGGEHTIDASGCYVTPGFIDVDNHSDTYWQIFLDPQLESLIYQGITTIIGGNCGSSLAPLTDRSSLQSIQKWTNITQINLNWLAMEEFLAEMERRRLTVNFGTLTGHSTLRRGLIKDEMRELKSEELAVMEKMLKRSFKEGSLGVSLGLAYTHARVASSRELSALALIAKKQSGVCTIHLRGEGEALMKAVEEAILLARAAKVRLHISHLKVTGRNNWPLMEKALYLLETAHLDGIEVTFDLYPYRSTGSVLYTLLPEWATEGGKKMILERLRDPALRHEAAFELKQKNIDYTRAILSTSSLNKMLTRRTLGEIAKAQNQSPEETIIDILIASDLRAVVLVESLNEENIEKGLQHPFSIVSTNGAGYTVEHAETGEHLHPRSFGTFPRVLARYVGEKKLLSWEEAIHKMTGKPALQFGVEERGLLRKDYRADIVVFHPEEIRDEATMEDPYAYASGLRAVLVNGEEALTNARATGARAGMVLRRKTSRWPFFS